MALVVTVTAVNQMVMTGTADMVVTVVVIPGA